MNLVKYSLLQVDIWNLKYPFLPLAWIGMNAMLVYVMAAEGIFAGFINGWYYGDPHNTLVCFLFIISYILHSFLWELRKFLDVQFCNLSWKFQSLVDNIH